jgi:hypothetical protein
VPIGVKLRFGASAPGVLQIFHNKKGASNMLAPFASVLP